MLKFAKFEVAKKVTFFENHLKIVNDNFVTNLRKKTTSKTTSKTNSEVVFEVESTSVEVVFEVVFEVDSTLR